MKSTLTFGLAILCSVCYAQDPKITSPTVAPSPGLVNGPVTSSVGFENASTLPILYSPANPTYISFTLVKITPTLDGSGIPQITGAGAAYFDWSATLEANNTWTILGIQNQTIPGMPDPFTAIGGPIEIPGTINAASTPADAAANNGDGFNANIIPAAGLDIDNSQESNNQSVYGSTNGTLPVTLVSFTAAKEGQVINLLWQTTEETNASHFEVQHSADAKNWVQIGRVTAAGESKSRIDYSFVDLTPISGTNYYRLKMIDNDLTFAYSRIQSDKFEGTPMTIYPNPASDILHIKDLNNNGLNMISIRNLKGQIVYASSSVPVSGINVKNLPAGIYSVSISKTNGVLNTQKVIVTR